MAKTKGKSTKKIIVYAANDPIWRMRGVSVIIEAIAKLYSSQAGKKELQRQLEDKAISLLSGTGLLKAGCKDLTKLLLEYYRIPESQLPNIANKGAEGGGKAFTDWVAKEIDNGRRFGTAQQNKAVAKRQSIEGKAKAYME